MTPTLYASENGKAYSKATTKEHKKSRGQFFTPVQVSTLMASFSYQPSVRSIRLCDPGSGPAILTCSLVEKLIENGVEKIHADLFETDNGLLEVINDNMSYLQTYCLKKNVKFVYRVINENFLLYINRNLAELTEHYDIVISNPPYFKLNKGDIHIRATKKYISGITNIYAGFIAASIRVCKVTGECILIVPRSFTSGLYFKSLRNYMFKESRIKRIHLFNSRTKAFKEDKVLQETVILRLSNNEGTTTEVSTSNGLSDIHSAQSQVYQITELVDLQSEDKVLHIPRNKDEFKIIQKLKRLQYRLSDHKIKVSTGRVVAYRSKAHITECQTNNSVPLIWGDNITEQQVVWPLVDSKKPQFINRNAGAILIPNANYVVQRRFSAKEDKKRLICAPIIESEIDFEFIGLENKTNFFYKTDKTFSLQQVYGLSTLLNSKIYDDYFRMINGNINVSSTEMKLLPVPKLSKIEKLGQIVLGQHNSSETLNEIVEEVVFSNIEEPLTV